MANLTDGKFRLVREPNAAPRWHPCQLIGEDANSVFLSGYAQSIFRVPREGGVNDMSRIDLAPPPPHPQPGQFSQAPDGAFWYLTDRRQVARLNFSRRAILSSKFSIWCLVEMLEKMRWAKFGWRRAPVWERWEQTVLAITHRRTAGSWTRFAELPPAKAPLSGLVRPPVVENIQRQMDALGGAIPTQQQSVALLFRLTRWSMGH